MNENEAWDRPETAEERVAAERLRRALDGADGDAREEVESELEVAALLQSSVDARGTLSPERADAVWARVAGAGKERSNHRDTESGSSDEKKAGFGKKRLSTLGSRRSTSSGAARRRRMWRFGAAGAAAVAAAAAVVVAVFFVGERGGDTTRLPPPGIALLKAQTEAAARGKSIVSLGAEMRAYRAQMYAALARTYGGAR